jgi:hypothetical protein
MEARFHLSSLFPIYSVYGMRFSDLLGGPSSEAGGKKILIKLILYNVNYNRKLC